MAEFNYDVVVLGGGTAGSQAAATAVQAGARTVMFNDGELGGLCILRGCMPTKTMLHAAHLAHEARHHRTAGIGHTAPAIDFAAIMANKDDKVARFQRAKIASIESGGYEVVDARARFGGPDHVIAGGDTYRFAKGAVIATGSVPHVPELPGLDDVTYLTSDEVMQLQELPESVVVLGSGAIGLELAQFFCRLGTHVQLASRRRVFSGVDPLLADEMEAALQHEPNLELLAPAAPLRVGRGANDNGIEVDVSTEGSPRTLVAQCLVLATGRRAAVDDLNLAAAGVELDGGTVVCGADMATSNPRVFVAGDARGTGLLLHVANWEGRIAGLGAAQAPGEHRLDDRLDMQVVFTDPTFATIGLSEDQARRAGHDVVAAAARFPDTGRAITQDVLHGAFKLIASRRDGEILGCQILGPRADDLIHTLAAVMFYRGTVADLLKMPWYHPTLIEVTMSLARDLERQLARR